MAMDVLQTTTWYWRRTGWRQEARVNRHPKYAEEGRRTCESVRSSVVLGKVTWYADCDDDTESGVTALPSKSTGCSVTLSAVYTETENKNCAVEAETRGTTA